MLRLLVAAPRQVPPQGDFDVRVWLVDELGRPQSAPAPWALRFALVDAEDLADAPPRFVSGLGGPGGRAEGAGGPRVAVLSDCVLRPLEEGALGGSEALVSLRAPDAAAGRRLRVAVADENGAALPVLSAPLAVEETGEPAEAPDRGSAPVVRLLAVAPGERLALPERFGGGGVLGSHAWDSGVMLARFLLRGGGAGAGAAGERVVRGRRVVELGCGLGMPGLAAARAGAAEVLLTDRAEATPWTEQAVALNGAPEGVEVEVRPLEWGADVGDGDAGRFDVALAADCLYDWHKHEPLLATALALVGDTGRVVIAHKPRHQSATSTFQGMREFCMRGNACRLAGLEVTELHREGAVAIFELRVGLPSPPV